MNSKNSFNLALLTTALSSFLLGLSIVLMGHHGHITLITDFFGLSELASGTAFNHIAGISFIVIALMLVASFYKPGLRQKSGILIMLVSLIPLVALGANSMWIESLGGFPAIGAGQGIIKYFALFSLGYLIAFPERMPVRAQQWVALFPAMLVLLWIGGMKFTALEAKGIEDLVISSPLMGWMYNVWDVQTTSNIIGVYDLIAMVLLIGAIYLNKLRVIAIAMSGAVFVTTQTFLISWSGALSAETLLSTGGHFLIKDLWYIANLLIFWHLCQVEQTNPVED